MIPQINKRMYMKHLLRSKMSLYQPTHSYDERSLVSQTYFKKYVLNLLDVCIEFVAKMAFAATFGMKEFLSYQNV